MQLFYRRERERASHSADALLMRDTSTGGFLNLLDIEINPFSILMFS